MPWMERKTRKKKSNRLSKSRVKPNSLQKVPRKAAIKLGRKTPRPN